MIPRAMQTKVSQFRSFFTILVHIQPIVSASLAFAYVTPLLFRVEVIRMVVCLPLQVEAAGDSPFFLR